MKLVIVESPAKAKTIEKYLGKDFEVDASGGHIRDLPEKKLGVNIRNNFEPEYENNASKAETIKRLKSKAKKAETVYLATDPDREGEAISWHLSHILGIDQDADCRIEFNEISKKAVGAALNSPRKINLGLVNAQQARRVLDRLVGYKLSPILCKKIQGKLSAGRVQSVALKIIADREKEINAFVPEEYWNIFAIVCQEQDREKNKDKALFFKMSLTEKDGKKIKPSNKKQADEILNAVEGKNLIVTEVKRSVTKTHAYPPFTTSTMQQEASTKLNLNSTMTMSAAQQLYEGVDIAGLGHTALVTYIRTDSVRVSDDAQNEARQFILNKWGKDYIPSKPNFYKSKKSSQDAHEAIRPISLDITPESLKDKLQKNQYRLYKLIYERFLASQMSEAQYNVLTIEAQCSGYTFKAQGKTPLFDGFTVVYEATQTIDKEENALKLPNVQLDDTLLVNELKGEQKFTNPPSRYTDASLIKFLEEKGVGRPSTYATIISTLTKRVYAERNGKTLVPTELGITVSDYMSKYFEDIVDVGFTAKMEDELDDIEENGNDWKQIVGSFYAPFEQKLKFVTEQGEKVKVEEESDVQCDKCGAMMIIKTGRYGKYLACPRFPDCQNIKSLKAPTAPEPSGQKCEKCGSEMVYKVGRYGKFLACSNYPDCKNIVNIVEKVASCPKCNKDVVKRKSKTGKIFYGCTGYPQCDFVSWDEPTDNKCPKCSGVLFVKVSSNGSKTLKCGTKGCDHSQKVIDE